MKRAFVAYCETCQWVGLVRSGNEAVFKYGGPANRMAHDDLATHFRNKRHDLDKPRKDGQNIYSVGVQDMVVRDLTAIERLEAFLS